MRETQCEQASLDISGVLIEMKIRKRKAESMIKNEPDYNKLFLDVLSYYE